MTSIEQIAKFSIGFRARWGLSDARAVVKIRVAPVFVFLNWGARWPSIFDLTDKRRWS